MNDELADRDLVEVLGGRGSNVPLIQEAARRPGELRPALVALLARPGDARIDAVRGALDYVPLPDWPPLASAALDAFDRDRTNRVAESVLGSALYQAPSALHPHLARIFFEMASFLETFGPGAWRGSGWQSLDALRPVLASGDREMRERAIEVLQQTHDPAVIAYALEEEAKLGGPFYWSYARNRYAYHEYFDVVDGEVRLLYAPQGYHLVFEPGYVRDQQRSPPRHPSWAAPDPLPGPAAFGGVLDEACPDCGRALQHVLTLDPPPDGLGVGADRLVLGVCTNGNCLGLGPGAELFYTHDADGQPHGMAGRATDRKWEIPYLAPTTVRFSPTEDRWLWQDWDSRWANLHRIGGLPSWVQEPGHPGCPSCGRTMGFLLQLDSGLRAQAGDHVHWCSGLLYAFWCDACQVSAFFRHCC
jgi:hypothetical protein